MPSSPITQRHVDNSHWHSPRPWRAREDGRNRWYVSDADDNPVTASICREDAEKIAALGNATAHHHEATGEVRSPSALAAHDVREGK